MSDKTEGSRVGRYEIKTPGGYPLDEATSALQKAIRRGHTVEALFWAMELREKFHKYLWRRLEIIACEDIGIANPMAIVVVNACANAYLKHAEEKSGGAVDGNLIAFPIIYMCQSAKSRSSDNLWGVADFIRNHSVLKVEVPDYALDKHTARGRKRIKEEGLNEVQYWHGMASIVSKEVYDPYFAKLIARVILDQPHVAEDAKKMLKERFGDDAEVYYNEVKEWLDILKPLHPNYHQNYTEEERKAALDKVLAI